MKQPREETRLACPHVNRESQSSAKQVREPVKLRFVLRVVLEIDSQVVSCQGTRCQRVRRQSAAARLRPDGRALAPLPPSTLP